MTATTKARAVGFNHVALEVGDIDEALNAAASVGDDTIQRRVQGQVNQESFTHGSAAQRQQWFRKGYSTGSVDDCNTFQ